MQSSAAAANGLAEGDGGGGPGDISHFYESMLRYNNHSSK